MLFGRTGLIGRSLEGQVEVRSGAAWAGPLRPDALPRRSPQELVEVVGMARWVPVQPGMGLEALAWARHAYDQVARVTVARAPSLADGRPLEARPATEAQSRGDPSRGGRGQLGRTLHSSGLNPLAPEIPPHAVRSPDSPQSSSQSPPQRERLPTWGFPWSSRH